MVLTQAVQIDVLDENDAFVTVVGDRVVEERTDVLPVPLSEKPPCLGDSARRIDEALPSRVLADFDQELPDQFLEPFRFQLVRTGFRLGVICFHVIREILHSLK
jgi:hypothetical protein